MQANQRVVPLPARPPSTSKEKPSASSKPKQPLRLDTTVPSSSLKAPSSYFTATSESKPIPDVGLSPRPVPPTQTHLNYPSRNLAPHLQGPPTAPAKHVVQKQPLSPDPWDDLSLDMDVDESFLEQVGMIEQGALGTGTNNDNGNGKNGGSSVRGASSKGAVWLGSGYDYMPRLPFRR